MSLWYKEIDKITFNDIDLFCKQQTAEGTQLDYKVDLPNELPKLVAAFANTLGGMILLGVDADKTTNMPIWPPTNGMPSKVGLEEQVIQICRDNIYPPIRPQISAILANDQLPDHILAVVRVEQSPEAPHAMSNGRHIYIRTGNVSKPFDLADINRIQHLLTQRQAIENQRLEYLRAEKERAERHLRLARQAPQGKGLGINMLAMRWVSVIPYYPWQPLCSAHECWLRLNFIGADALQRVPGGAFGASLLPEPLGRHYGRCESLSSIGHVFFAECASETWQYEIEAMSNPRGVRGRNYVSFDDCWTTVRRAFRHAADFYKSPQVAKPGYLLLSIGIDGALGTTMISHDVLRTRGSHPFIDQSFAAERAATFQEFIEDPSKAAGPLLKELAFGFDLQWPDNLEA
jgi:hypothetical protein